MAENPTVCVGQSWAYRARRIDDVVQVAILKLGSQKPPLVLARWADESFEGRQEWVSPARLKVLWAEVDEFRHMRRAGIALNHWECGTNR
jgi:hypothetical protein